jgi:predicted P-loop ATPase
MTSKPKAAPSISCFPFAALGQLLPLQTEDKRRPASDSAELMAALEEVGYQFTMRALDDLIEVNGRPLTDPLRAEIRTRMRDLGYKNLAAVEDAYTAWAYRHRYDPVRDYLRGLTWDGREHIARLAGYFRDDHPATYRAVTGESEYCGHRVFYLWLRRWLIGTAGKALDARQSAMLCLDSHQSAGKSFFVRWLGSVLPDYFSEAPLLPDDKDSLIRLTNTFVWELGEISHLTKRWDKNALKHLISTRIVTVRKPYHRFDTIKPALAGLIGALNNEAGFLTDPTGNRRFLVCRLRAIDWAYAEAVDPHQVWAEAVALYRAGEATLPTAEETRLQSAINQAYLVRSARRAAASGPTQLRLDTGIEN